MFQLFHSDAVLSFYQYIILRLDISTLSHVLEIDPMRKKKIIQSVNLLNRAIKCLPFGNRNLNENQFLESVGRVELT